jgi:Leucine-rich repeat (LRR) protein
MFICSAIEDGSSSTTILCFKCLDRDVSCKPDLDALEVRQSSLARLITAFTEVYINDYSLSEIHYVILTYKSLRAIVLANVGLTVIPDSIVNLSLLTKLSLSNNNLTSLPSNIQNLGRLIQLGE